jgi:hypothetical protein
MARHRPADGPASSVDAAEDLDRLRRGESRGRESRYELDDQVSPFPPPAHHASLAVLPTGRVPRVEAGSGPVRPRRRLGREAFLADKQTVLSQRDMPLGTTKGTCIPVPHISPGQTRSIYDTKLGILCGCPCQNGGSSLLPCAGPHGSSPNPPPVRRCCSGARGLRRTCPGRLRDLGRGVPQARAGVVHLDLVDGALLAFAGP